MNAGLPNPESDPSVSIDAIEAQLRGLPPPSVPEGLAGKLIGAIPQAVVGAAASTAAVKIWAVVVGIIAVGAVAVGLTVQWLSGENPVAPKPNANTNANAPAAQGNPAAIAPALQKELQRCEEATRNDPFDAAAWFNLAKAQLRAQRKADAIVSAHKALDIARSGRWPDLVAPVEAWLRANAK
jgi:cytochrome c-type biogenesis protein CcmH/NrfG